MPSPASRGATRSVPVHSGLDRLRPDADAGLTTILDVVVPQAEARREAAPDSAFDVCHGGLVLRAVLFVHAVVAIALAFTSNGWLAWLLDVAAAAAVALPATLLWLIVACWSRHRLARLGPGGQWGAAVLLGAACAAAGWGWVAWLSLPEARAGLGVFAPMLAGAAISAAIFHWLRLRAGMLLPATTTARLTELQSRIRPHFLFNTLNSAIALVRVDPGKAEEVLEDLAELFRSALTESRQQVTLGEEIELARRYLAIEQVRFGPRLQLHWELDPAAGPALVPPLLLQPLVENAVKHGVEPATEPGVVRVRTRVKNHQAVIHVTNSVPPGPSQPGQGMALRNVRERLRLLHDVAAHFDAGVSEPGVYRVRIVLPMPN
jgi:two-component system, LytTR family, sensor histidine kinase AlgZ